MIDVPHTVDDREWFTAAGGWLQFSDWRESAANPHHDHPPVVRILGFDPGKVNFAWSITDHIISPGLDMLSRAVASGLVPDVPQSMSGDLTEAVGAPTGFVRELVTEYTPITSVVAERFMASGLRVGTTIEVANLMAGVFLHMCWSRTGTPMEMVPAVTWKNAFNRAAGYGEALKDVYGSCAATPHQVDASLLGCFAASAALSCDPFESVASDGGLAAFLETLEMTSRQRLRAVRG